MIDKHQAVKAARYDHSVWMETSGQRGEKFAIKDLHAVTVDPCDLSGADMSSANCNRTIFKDCIFKNATFASANGKEASFDGCTFKFADMSSANFANAQFTNCTFEDVNFTSANIECAVFRNCTFVKTNFENARFKTNHILGYVFNNCKITESNFTGANCGGCVVLDSVISDCVGMYSPTVDEVFTHLGYTRSENGWIVYTKVGNHRVGDIITHERGIITYSEEHFFIDYYEEDGYECVIRHEWLEEIKIPVFGWETTPFIKKLEVIRILTCEDFE